jgi:hypothetical protein
MSDAEAGGAFQGQIEEYNRGDWIFPRLELR